MFSTLGQLKLGVEATGRAFQSRWRWRSHFYDCCFLRELTHYWDPNFRWREPDINCNSHPSQSSRDKKLLDYTNSKKCSISYTWRLRGHQATWILNVYSEKEQELIFSIPSKWFFQVGFLTFFSSSWFPQVIFFKVVSSSSFLQDIFSKFFFKVIFQAVTSLHLILGLTSSTGSISVLERDGWSESFSAIFNICANQ